MAVSARRTFSLWVDLSELWVGLSKPRMEHLMEDQVVDQSGRLFGSPSAFQMMRPLVKHWGHELVLT